KIAGLATELWQFMPSPSFCHSRPSVKVATVAWKSGETNGKHNPRALEGRSLCADAGDDGIHDPLSWRTEAIWTARWRRAPARAMVLGGNDRIRGWFFGCARSVCLTGRIPAVRRDGRRLFHGSRTSSLLAHS